MKARMAALVLLGTIVVPVVAPAFPFNFAGLMGVSPGALERFVRLQSICPTFSWTSQQDAAYEIEVYFADEQGPDIGRPVLRQSLPEGATTWTPAEDKCLGPGRRYAWSVRAVKPGADGDVSRWSEPLLFEIPTSAVTLQQYEVLQDSMATSPDGRQNAVSRQTMVPGAIAKPRSMQEPAAGSASVASSEKSEVSSSEAQTSLEGGPPTGASGLVVESNDAAGAAAAFISDVGGKLISGQALGSEVFSVDSGGNVSATSYAGDGSNLTGLLVAGQTCPPGQSVFGITAEGDLFCTPTNTISTTVDDSANTVGTFSSLAIGLDGNPVIAYYDFTAFALKVAKCNDAACMGMDETVTTVYDPDNHVGRFCSLAIGLDGNPVISYYDDNTAALMVAKCNDPACAGMNEAINIVDDPANDVGQYSSIAIGVDGFPVISYYDDTDNALKVAKCTDAACTDLSSIITTLDDSANDVGQYTSIAIGLDEFPVISYFDNTAFSLKVVKCNDITCSTSLSPTTVDDPADGAGQYSSIAVGLDGNPVISYYNGGATTLRVAKCNDPACSGMNETITTVDDSINNVGAHTSIAIGSDGNPVISYYDATAGALKVAKCNDPACAGMDETITTVDDPADDVGSSTSIAIGLDGNPVISHQDVTNFTLRVSKCANPACSP